MSNWVYRVETLDWQIMTMKRDLDALGAEGWELVSVAMHPGGYGAPTFYQCFFKRPLGYAFVGKPEVSP